MTSRSNINDDDLIAQPDGTIMEVEVEVRVTKLGFGTTMGDMEDNSNNMEDNIINTNMEDNIINTTIEDNTNQVQVANIKIDPDPAQPASVTSFASSSNSSSLSDSKGSHQEMTAICPLWTRFTDGLRAGIVFFVHTLSNHAARHPKAYVIGVPVLSFLLVGIGLATNFEMTMDPEQFLIPTHTPAQTQFDWLSNSQEGFHGDKETPVTMLIHSHGANVLTRSAMRHTMQMMEVVMTTPGYAQVCDQKQTDLPIPYYYHQPKCLAYSVTRFWNHNLTEFDLRVHSDQDVMDQVSSTTFVDTNTPAAHEALLGNYRRDNTTHHIITYAESYVINLAFPKVHGVVDMEYAMIDRLFDLRQAWEVEASPDEVVVLEFLTPFSLEQEVTRAILADAWLVPLVILIMTNFVAWVFYQNHKVKSRWLLGYGAVFTVAFSLLTGFGTMFILGVPATSMIPILPYIVFGIALDDTFIITGAYFRTATDPVDNNKKDATITGDNNTDDDGDDMIVRRVNHTMKEVGVSITLTTITTMVAFLLSSLSTIPSIRWLGWYASWTIFVDFIFQITFFVALLVLDERRIRDNRRDVCFWIVVAEEPDQYQQELSESGEGDKTTHSSSKHDEGEVHHSTTEEGSDSNDGDNILARNPRPGHIQDSGSVTVESSLSLAESSCSSTGEAESQLQDPDSKVAVPPEHRSHTHASTQEEALAPQRRLNFAERVMVWYSQNLLLKRWFQCLVVVGFLGYFVACCFSTTLLKQEWKVQDFVPGDSYISTFADALTSYMSFTTLSAVYFRHVNQSDPIIQDQMRAYYSTMSTLPQTNGDKPFPFCWVTDFPAIQDLFGFEHGNMTFAQQLDFALAIPSIREVYGNDIVRHPDTGDIVASRCWFFLTNVDFDVVEEQLDFYHDQYEVTRAQPINQGLVDENDWPFFSFEFIYFVWEFFDAIAHELTFSTISGVVAVSLIGFTLIPHWTASIYLVPLIIMLYIDVMGTIQFMGLHVDSMTFVCLIVSVGLLVDFLMHVLLRYYESPGRTRQEKTQTTLTTMGASIFVGGLSTFLGILPLALGTSMIMRTVFLCFFAMVVLGVGHGLIFLPVLLSLFGPVNYVAANEALEEQPVGGEDNQPHESASV